MKLLLDTHGFLWFAFGNAELSGKARALIEDMNNEVFLSVASIWEMALKISLEKLPLPKPLHTIMSEALSPQKITLLNISLAHAVAVATLPFYDKGHKDPFDRLLIVQAQVENMPLLSRDENFDSYPIKRLW